MKIYHFYVFPYSVFWKGSITYANMRENTLKICIHENFNDLKVVMDFLLFRSFTLSSILSVTKPTLVTCYITLLQWILCDVLFRIKIKHYERKTQYTLNKAVSILKGITKN